MRILARFAVEGEAALWDRRSENGMRKVDEDVMARRRGILAGRPPRPQGELAALGRLMQKLAGLAPALLG